MTHMNHLTLVARFLFWFNVEHPFSRIFCWGRERGDKEAVLAGLAPYKSSSTMDGNSKGAGSSSERVHVPGNHDEGKGKGGSTFDPPSIVNERDAAARDKGCGGGVGGLAGDEYCAVVRRSTLHSPCCSAAFKPTKIYPILITGTPRSGTVFTQKYLNALGVRTSYHARLQIRPLVYKEL